MGSLSKLFAITIFFMVLSLFFIPIKAKEEGFISAVISSKGLEFTKDLLIKEAISSIIPLRLPQIEKTVKIPFIGQVDVALSNITIYSVDIASSYVKTGDSGIAVVASGATANLSMNWQYSYTTWLFEVSDSGNAFIQIISAVEENISNKVKGIVKLDSSLHSLPKQIKLDDVTALNVPLVDIPVLSNSSIEFQINGLFTAPIDNLAPGLDHNGSLDPLPCSAPAKMVEISLHEDVFNSMSLVFFNANYMNWMISKIPDQSLLNTAGWRYIIPQLYKQYPNKDMDLNVSVSSQPIITVVNDGIDITVYSDVTIDIIWDEVISLVCITMVYFTCVLRLVSCTTFLQEHLYLLPCFVKAAH